MESKVLWLRLLEKERKKSLNSTWKNYLERREIDSQLIYPLY